MKRYLFGLGAMLAGAGLMFVLMHGEVSAENKDINCKLFYSSSSDRSRTVSRFFCAAVKPGRILIASLK